MLSSIYYSSISKFQELTALERYIIINFLSSEIVRENHHTFIIVLINKKIITVTSYNNTLLNLIESSNQQKGIE